MKKRLIIITLILTTVAAAVYAGPRRQMRTQGIGQGLAFLAHLDRARAELDLSDAQVEQLKAIAKATHDQNAQYREQMDGTFKQVATTLLTNPNDIAGAQAALDQQDAAEKVLKTNLLTAASKALNVLTPEQRTKLALHLAERSQRRENRRR
ncbi:MAG TPA: periplasmic heavy metal sensor [Thermoanaerobaculia bacterium]|nr:periplasmic heavy metal sensor [Thermoanaerobaculia bacterium]